MLRQLRRCFWKAEEAFKFLKSDPSLYQLVLLPLHYLIQTDRNDFLKLANPTQPES